MSDTMKFRSSLVSEGITDDFSEEAEQVSSDSQDSSILSLRFMLVKDNIVKGGAQLSMLSEFEDFCSGCSFLIFVRSKERAF